MTKAEARRMLNCVDDYALADKLGVAFTTVWRWRRMVPRKYHELVRLKSEAR